MHCWLTLNVAFHDPLPKDKAGCAIRDIPFLALYLIIPRTPTINTTPEFLTILLLHIHTRGESVFYILPNYNYKYTNKQINIYSQRTF